MIWGHRDGLELTGSPRLDFDPDLVADLKQDLKSLLVLSGNLDAAEIDQMAEISNLVDQSLFLSGNLEGNHDAAALFAPRSEERDERAPARNYSKLDFTDQTSLFASIQSADGAKIAEDQYARAAAIIRSDAANFVDGVRIAIHQTFSLKIEGGAFTKEQILATVEGDVREFAQNNGLGTVISGIHSADACE